MNNEKLNDLLYIFKDGETTAAERSELFKGLADKPELQEEFHELMRFHNSAIKENITIAPAAGVSSNIFKAVGISQASNFLPYLLKFGLYPVMFIVGFCVNSLVSDEADDIIKTQNAISHQELIEYQNFEKDNEIALIETAEPKAVTRKATQKFYQPVTKETNASQATESLVDNEAITDKIPLISDEPKQETSNIFTENINQNESNSSQLENTLPVSENKSEILKLESTSYINFLSGYEFSGSNITGVYIYPVREQIANYDNGLNNFSFGASYRLNDKHYIGVEFARETFDLFVESNNDLILNKSLYLYGLKYKYEFVDYTYFSSLYAFSESVVGGTQVGPFAKTRLGLIWKPENIVKMYAAIEGGYLSYLYNNKYEYTGKFSFNYGIMLNF